MGFLSRFREKTRGLTLPLIVAGAALGAGAARAARADVIAPLSAARVQGLYGSDWHDRQLLRNTSDEALSGMIYLTLRGASFNPATDAAQAYSLPAHTTLTIEDIFAALKPGVNGAGTLRLVPGEGQDAPLWRATMFNRVDEKEFGAQAITFDPDADGYHAAGKTLGTILSPDGYRDNPAVQSGPDGISGKWVYTNTANANKTEVPFSLAPNVTFQYTGGVTGLLGFPPEPGGQLDLVIENGSARAFLSRNNNASNDPAYDEMTARTTTVPSDYVNTVAIYVMANGVPQQFSETHPSEDIIKKVWQVNQVSTYLGSSEWVCEFRPDPVVNSLPEVISNYNTRLNPEEQMEFSGNRNGFIPFVNDGDNDGLPCDEDEPDHQFVYLVTLNVEHR